MSQGAQSLHISGAKVAPDIQMDANANNALQHIKQQLLTYQVENKKLSDQLNCLVSLIKRFGTHYFVNFLSRSKIEMKMILTLSYYFSIYIHNLTST